MLAKPEDIETDLIGQLDFLDQIVQTPRCLRALVKSGIGIDVSESIKAKFHGETSICC